MDDANTDYRPTQDLGCVPGERPPAGMSVYFERSKGSWPQAITKNVADAVASQLLEDECTVEQVLADDLPQVSGSMRAE